MVVCHSLQRRCRVGAHPSLAWVLFLTCRSGYIFLPIGRFGGIAGGNVGGCFGPDVKDSHVVLRIRASGSGKSACAYGSTNCASYSFPAGSSGVCRSKTLPNFGTFGLSGRGLTGCRHPPVRSGTSPNASSERSAAGHSHGWGRSCAAGHLTIMQVDGVQRVDSGTGPAVFWRSATLLIALAGPCGTGQN